MVTRGYQQKLFSDLWENRQRLFVVHMHDASRLHFDFRLEHDGILKSWVVPNGPCLDSTQHREAVLVNDHKIECAEVEGIIPQGLYGAGTILLWDGGTWKTDQDVDQAIYKGRLKFQLHGVKLKGNWLLKRISARPLVNREKWRLIKESDCEARSLSEMDILLEQPRSVLTGRSLAEVASDPLPFIPKKSGLASKPKRPDSDHPFLL